MSDDQQGTPRPADETQPVRPEGAAALPQPPATTAAPAASEAYEPAPAARRGFRERFGSLRRTQGGDRSYGLAALIASALAGIIVGGLGLTAVHAIAHDGPGDRGRWMEQRGPTGRDGDDFGGRGPMHGPMQGGPPGLPGQVQPTTPPDEDDGSNG